VKQDIKDEALEKPESAIMRDHSVTRSRSRLPTELTDKEKAQRKNVELQRAESPEPPAPKTGSFDSDGGCLQDRRSGCKGTPIRMGRWKGYPNFICACGHTTLSVPAKVLAAAKTAGLL